MRPGISPRCAGRATWMRSGCGRSRTAGVSASPGAGAARGRRTGRPGRAAPDGRFAQGRAPSRGSPIRSTRSRSRARSSRTAPSEFPVAYLDEQAMEIRLARRPPRTISSPSAPGYAIRLRWHLLELIPELEAPAGSRRALNMRADARSRRPAAAKAARERAGPDRASCSRRSAGSPVRSTTLDARLLELIKHTARAADRARLRTARRRDPDRPHRRRRAVPTDASFALHSGTAPIPCSSGQANPIPPEPRR